MATTSRLFFVYVDGQRKAIDSRNASVLFQKLGLTSNGVDQGIEITSDGTGFDFASKAIANLTLDGTLIDVNTIPTDRVIGLDALIENLSANLASEVVALQDNCVSINTAVKGVQDNCVSINTAVKGVQDNCVAINTAVKGVQDNCVSINTAIGALGDNCVAINTAVKGVQDNCVSINTAIGALGDNCVSINAAIGAIEGDIDNLQSSVLALGDNCVSINNAIGDLAGMGLKWDGPALDVNVDNSTLTIDGNNTVKVLTIDSGNIALSSALDLAGQKIINLAMPDDPSDGATKEYVDFIAAGLDIHAAVLVATTDNLSVTAAGAKVGKTLTFTSNGAIDSIIDGYSLNVSDRVLVHLQTNAYDNGIYVVSNVGAVGYPAVLTRASDFDGSINNEVAGGDFVLVVHGDTYQSNGFAVIADGIVEVDNAAINWTIVSGPQSLVAGPGLGHTGNEFHVKVDNVTTEVYSANVIVKDSGITDAKLATSAVTNVKLATDAVETDKILNAAVTNVKLATDAVETAKILNAAVTNVKLATDAVETAKILNGAVTNVKLATDAVETDKILNGAVTIEKLSASGAVTQGEPISSLSAVYYNPSDSNVYIADASNSNLARYQVGVMTDPATADFDGCAFRTIVPGFSGLTDGLLVFVDNVTPGLITHNIATETGYVVYQVGYAVGTNSVLVAPEFLYIVE